MGTLFYIILVFFSDKVEWSWLWFFVSLFFSGSERVIYKYTNNPDLEGSEE
jgi:hypothetical protein